MELPRMGVLNRIVENDLIRRVDPDEYRARVKDVYGGPQGALLSTASMISLHIPLGKRLLRTRKFDLRGMKSILDVGSGAGQIAGHLLEYADPDARIVCTDLSHPMLCRARRRLDSDRPEFVVADLSALPFADESFDGVTCGYVLEHLPGSGRRPRRAGARNATRRADAAANNGRQFFRRVDKPHLVLPDL